MKYFLVRFGVVLLICIFTNNCISQNRIQYVYDLNRDNVNQIADSLLNHYGYCELFDILTSEFNFERYLRGDKGEQTLRILFRIEKKLHEYDVTKDVLNFYIEMQKKMPQKLKCGDNSGFMFYRYFSEGKMHLLFPELKALLEVAPCSHTAEIAGYSGSSEILDWLRQLNVGYDCEFDIRPHTACAGYLLPMARLGDSLANSKIYNFLDINFERIIGTAYDNWFQYLGSPQYIKLLCSKLKADTYFNGASGRSKMDWEILGKIQLMDSTFYKTCYDGSNTDVGYDLLRKCAESYTNYRNPNVYNPQ